jgi:hypothetical protein
MLSEDFVLTEVADVTQNLLLSAYIIDLNWKNNAVIINKEKEAKV